MRCSSILLATSPNYFTLKYFLKPKSMFTIRSSSFYKSSNVKFRRRVFDTRMYKCLEHTRGMRVFDILTGKSVFDKQAGTRVFDKFSRTRVFDTQQVGDNYACLSN